jgi:hypothetical protein
VTDTTIGDAALPKQTFHTENELQDKPTTPSKEELETNEKNLISSEGGVGRLGQLVFKLRSDHPLYMYTFWLLTSVCPYSDVYSPHFITNFMEPSLSPKDNSRPAPEEIPNIIRNPMIH